jgi:hypothetical protein
MLSATILINIAEYSYCRYVEMLEQQRSWLLHGLQELYRRTIDGKGWPGELLKLEPNGHPLIHDLLIRLGVLDHNKDDRSELMHEIMREEPWDEPWCFTTAHIQHQATSDLFLDDSQIDQLPFDSQMIMDYMSSTPSVNFNSDSEDFSRFLDSNLTEITPI